MQTVSLSLIEVAWYSLAWFVIGVIGGFILPRPALRSLLSGRGPSAQRGGGAPAGHGGSVEIYVGNLAYGITKRDLEKKFQEYGGVVDVRIIHNKLTGKSKGYAFVSMADKKSAADAVKAINGAEFKGRVIVANEAKSRARD